MAESLAACLRTFQLTSLRLRILSTGQLVPSEETARDVTWLTFPITIVRRRALYSIDGVPGFCKDRHLETLQPDLQYIASPSGIHRDALAVGLRFQVTL